MKLPGKKALLVVGVVAALQAGGFFLAMKLFSGGPTPTYGAESGGHAAPADAHGGEAHAPAGAHGDESPHYAAGGDPRVETATVEVPLLQKFRVPNNRSGRSVLYDFDIAVVVKAERKAEMEALAKDRAGEISDQVAQLVRAADTRMLQEFDFRTLRLQIQHALNEIVRDDKLIQRVLIPRCVPLQTG
jgi:hypothetical protein